MACGSVNDCNLLDEGGAICGICEPQEKKNEKIVLLHDKVHPHSQSLHGKKGDRTYRRQNPSVGGYATQDSEATTPPSQDERRSL